jgi:amino acid adenylation domain-containing protein/non-ribosomal peptide synthase protein (TIGR01720 family)
LEKELPLRARLYEVGEREHVLLLVLHHIAGDGWSLGPLARDVEQAYGARVEGRAPGWESLRVQYGDYTLWQREMLGRAEEAGSVLGRQLEYWKQALRGMPEEVELPWDRKRSGEMSYAGGTVGLELDEGLHRGLLALGRRSGASLFMVLQAGLGALLNRLGAGEDIAIGTVVAGRNEEELEEQIGFFVNTVVLRTDVSGDPSFAELVERVRRRALEAYQNQELPFERLVEELQPARTQGRHPLFQVMLVLQNAPEARLKLPGLEIELVTVRLDQSQFDLALMLTERSDASGNPAGIAALWEYSSQLLDRESVIRFASSFEQFMRQAVAEPQKRIWEMDIQANEAASKKSKIIAGTEKRSKAAIQASGTHAGTIGNRPRKRESKRMPRTPQEEIFCRLFAELLSLEQVGANENFFHLGGDSILSLQLVSKARKAGLVLAARDIFQHQTPEALALAAAPARPVAGTPALVDEVGPFPATPIIRSLFEQGSAFKRFHQSVLLQVPDNLQESEFVRLLQLLVDQHGSLRLRLGPDRKLQIAPRGRVDAKECLRILDIASNSELAENARLTAEHGLDPEAGTIFQAVWFLKDYRLLLMVHHLAVDGVSWRILLSDLAAGWKAMSHGVEPVLEPVATPFRRWAEYLAERGGKQALLSELGHWENALSGAQLLAGRQLDSVKDTIASAGNLRVSLPVELTTALLTDVLKAFHAQINDVLLAALALASLQWRSLRGATGANDRSITIALEGHGREPMDSGLDLSRTVGWFTSVYPVRLDLQGIDLDAALTGQMAAGRALKLAKDQLRTIPAHGLNYGLLRYSDAAADQLSALPGPQLAFNYLGRFTVQEGANWLPVGNDAGFAGGADAEMPLLHMVEIDAVVADGSDGARLTANFGWATNHLEENDVRTLASFWQSALESISQQAQQHDTAGHSASDFPLIHLSLDEVEKVEAVFPTLVDILPLTPLQEGLLFHSLLQTGNDDVYAVQTNLEFTGEMHAERLRQAMEVLLMRYANLRVSIYGEGLSQPVQVVPATVDLPWCEVDLSALSEDDQKLRRAEILAAERAQGFTFSAGPLLRFVLIRLEAERHLLVFTNHHLILDGWSTPVLISEMLELYSNGLAADALPRVRPYTDYLTWLVAQDRSSALEVWKDYLQGVEGPTIVASPLREQPESKGLPATWQRDLPAELTSALNSMARSHNLTLNAVLQGLWAMLLARLNNLDDVLFGITVSGRTPDLAGTDQMVGLFINTVPLRVRFDSGERVVDVLARIQASQSAMLNVYHLGLSEIQRATGFEQLFDTIFVFENYPIDRSLLTRSFAGLRIAGVEMRDGAHYPLALMIAPGEELRVRLDYDPARFAETQAASIASRFLRLLESAVSEPCAPWHQVDWFSAGERRRLLEEFNQPSLPLPAATMAEIFEEQAAQRPQAIAIVQGERAMTYEELNRRANRMAHCLMEKGIGPEAVVGVAMRRSIERTAVLIGIWKAGGAYLALDPDYPHARLEHMMTDALPALVVTEINLQPQMPQAAGVEFLALDSPEFAAALEHAPTNNPNGLTLPGHPAYVIYTSGSTGIPKGVVVTHEGIGSLAASQEKHFELTEASRILQFASLNFDASFWELLMAISAGATLVLPEEQREGAALYDLLHSQRVTHALLPIPVLASMEEFDALPLEYLINGGEALSASTVARWSGGLQMVNAYGPTEATVCATISLPLSGTENPTIGSPISNTRVYVLDRNLELAPVGVGGEIYISGAGLARGYLKRAGLTAERFLANPNAAEPGERMYRTGDMARWRADGTLEFIGRADEQVKVRGFRIELGEIETALRALTEIADVAVVVREEAASGKQIVAYFVPHDGAVVEPAALRRRLSERLPAHMLPATFIPLEKLPRSPNGKVNRNALPAAISQPRNVRAPRSPEEATLCAMFAEVLRLEQVNVEDDFFALGGDSLSAMRLAGRVSSGFGITLSLRDFYSASTVCDLATLVEAIRFATSPVVASNTSLSNEVFEEEDI